MKMNLSLCDPEPTEDSPFQGNEEIETSLAEWSSPVQALTENVHQLRQKWWWAGKGSPACSAALDITSVRPSKGD